MLDEAIIRKDLEKIARDIVSKKLWPVLDAAIFLGYSRNNMDMIIDRENLYTIRVGGRKHIYAIDILKLFERQTGMTFPELEAQWYRDHRLPPPDEK